MHRKLFSPPDSEHTIFGCYISLMPNVSFYSCQGTFPLFQIHFLKTLMLSELTLVWKYCLIKFLSQPENTQVYMHRPVRVCTVVWKITCFSSLILYLNKSQYHACSCICTFSVFSSGPSFPWFHRMKHINLNENSHLGNQKQPLYLEKMEKHYHAGWSFLNMNILNNN